MEDVSVKAAKPNGCFNRKPFRSSFVAQDGNLRHDKSMFKVYVEVPFRMAMDCRYTHTTLGQADPGCVGCKHKVEK